MPMRGVRIELVTALARAAGVGGMAGGQMLDLAAEGRFGAQKHGAERRAHAAGDEDRRAVALRLPGRRHSRRGGKPQRAALERYGAAVGEAFQIADDLLDIEGDPALVGKQTGKDAAAGKATFVSVLGVAGAKARLRELVAEAEAALAPFGQAAAILIEGARFVADRHA